MSTTRRSGYTIVWDFPEAGGASQRRSINSVKRAVSPPARRGWVTLTVTLAAVLVELLLVLGSSPSDPVVLALVLLALATAATCTSVRVIALTPGLGVTPPTGDQDDAPMRRGRPTDPTHHPLAPRAPGLV